MICLPFTCNTLMHFSSSCTNGIAALNNPLYFPRNQTAPLAFSVRCISSNTSPNEQSLAVSYLIDSCGLSPNTALPASKYVKSVDQQRADSFLNFLKSHGFSNTHISKIIAKAPRLLLTVNPEKTLLPKLEFFYSKGFSKLELANFVCGYSYILHRDLEKVLIPNYNRITELIGDEAKTFKIVKKFTRILYDLVECSVIPKVNHLLAIGVPNPRIVYLLGHVPFAFSRGSDNFERDVVLVDELRGMGFLPEGLNFSLAFVVMVSLTNDSLERKVKAYKSRGWSDEDIRASFLKYPLCMMQSVDKIDAAMDYFVNHVGWEPSVIAKYPLVIGLSLEKRIISRCTVVQMLWSQGLVERGIRPSTLLLPSEEIFLQRYVCSFTHHSPYLLRLYEESKVSAK